VHSLKVTRSRGGQAGTVPSRVTPRDLSIRQHATPAALSPAVSSLSPHRDVGDEDATVFTWQDFSPSSSYSSLFVRPWTAAGFSM